jgi:hypothetical protein
LLSNALGPRSRFLLIPELSKLKEFARTLRTFQHMKIFVIRQIQLFGMKHPSLKRGVIEAANTVGIRIVFEDMLLKLLEKNVSF